ncbi:hypothetical protein ACHWQZ_G012614 [Mnemiopsis leidyi]
MVTSNDYHIFGIHSDAERCFWGSYYLFVHISAVLGDTLILYASFQKNSFKLNKFIVTVIQYIAVADLTYAVTSALPSSISLFAGGWVLGDALCYIKVYSSYFIGPGVVCLIPVLTAGKFLILKYPTRIGFWKEETAHRVCVIVLIVPFIIPFLLMIVDKNDIIFDYRIYTCDYKFTEDIWRTVTPIMSIITIFIPNIVIVSTTVPTLKYLYAASRSARRVQGSIPWQGALTVTLTGLVYCISAFPLFICYLGKGFVEETSFLLIKFYRIANFVSMINTVSNFYIYALTVKSFRRFLVLKVLSINMSIMSRESSSTETGTKQGRTTNETETNDKRKRNEIRTQ